MLVVTAVWEAASMPGRAQMLGDTQDLSVSSVRPPLLVAHYWLRLFAADVVKRGTPVGLRVVLGLPG